MKPIRFCFFFSRGDEGDVSARATGAVVTTDEVVGVEADLVEAAEVFILAAGAVEGILCFGLGFFLGRPRPVLAAADVAAASAEAGEEEIMEEGKTF